MACPYRHRNISAQKILDISEDDSYSIEREISNDLLTNER